VHLFFPGDGGVTRADIEIKHFVEALKGQMKLRRKKRG
jgi:hypothetical protein